MKIPNKITEEIDRIGKRHALLDTIIVKDIKQQNIYDEMVRKLTRIIQMSKNTKNKTQL